MKKNSRLYNALNIWLGQGCCWVASWASVLGLLASGGWLVAAQSFFYATWVLPIVNPST